jgi:putative ABC transport system permease protein
MSLFMKTRSFLRNLLLSGRLDSDLGQELHSHLEMVIEQNLRAGMSPSEARRSAQIELGGIEQVKEQVRQERVGNWLYSVLADCRFALRQLRKSSAFTAVSLLTLTVGIGANTAIFSFADLLLNHPVSLPDLKRLVYVDEIRPGGEEASLSHANFRDLRAETKTLDSFASYQEWVASRAGSNGAEDCRAVRAGEDFFGTLGTRPILGRVFLPEEHSMGKNRVVVLSYAFWQREFAGDPGVVDKTLRLDEERYTIVGVMPTNFQFPPGAQLWTPLAVDDANANERNNASLEAVGRLSATATVEKSRAELNTLWGQLQQRYPEVNRQWQLSVLPLQAHLVDEDSRQFARLFLCVAGFVLLIACVNVANLQLSRSASRERELAIRAAVGAGRSRIIRQLFTENLLLAAVGGAGGLLLAFWGLSVMRANMPAQVREICDVSGMRMDVRAFAFTFFATAVAGLLSGAIPAVRGSRVNLRDSLETGGARVAGEGQRLRRAFVISEVILAVVLLIGAGLMVKGFYLLATRQTVMAPQTLLTFHINLSPNRYGSPEQQRAFYSQLLDSLRRIPGVEGESAVSGLPYSFYEKDRKVLPEESRGAPLSDLPGLMEEAISDDYFRVLRLPLVEGRLFDQRDGAGAPAVGIVSESMAHRLWPGVQHMVGRRIKLPESERPDEWISIVGVVGDIRHEVYDRSFRSILYTPMGQAADASMDFALRTSADPHRLVESVRSAVAELDSTQPITLLQTMEEKITQQASALQFVAILMGILGLVAIMLSSAGIYGLIAYSLAERRREIGIRMALGARPSQVLAMVVRLTGSLVAVGGAIGLLVGFTLAQILSSMLYGVRAWDPAVYALVPLVLAFVTLLATFVPALKAARVDPSIALRYE